MELRLTTESKVLKQPKDFLIQNHRGLPIQL